MFDNLVESSSHKGDLSRKGSFILVTTVVYGILGLAFFVAGIYWYDAHLENQNLDLITLVAPVPVPPQQAQPDKPDDPKPTKVEQNVDVRRSSCGRLPNGTSAKRDFGEASDVPPVRRGVVTQIGVRIRCSGSHGGRTAKRNRNCAPTKVDIAEPPPEAPKPTPPGSYFRWCAKRKSDQSSQACLSGDCKATARFGDGGGPVVIDENGCYFSRQFQTPIVASVAVGPHVEQGFRPRSFRDNRSRLQAS